MKRDQERLEDINISDPCTADWDAMRGGDQKRHCEECDLNVHNLSAMTRADGEELLALRRTGERVCVRMELHADGSCITADEPRERSRPGKLATAALALGVGLSAACHTEEERAQELTPQVEEAAAEPEVPDAECLQLLGSVRLIPDECAEEEASEEALMGEPELAPDCAAAEDGLAILGGIGDTVPAPATLENSAEPSGPAPASEPAEGAAQADAPHKRRTMMGSPGPRR